MQTPLRLSEFVATLALAQDNAFGQPLESQLRSCVLAVWLSEAAGVGPTVRDAAYWVALLRYVGCTGHAHEVATVFGDEIAIELQRADAPQVLINLTNLGWFGDTTAIPQHVLASRMRALETGRPMLRATNSGGTAAIGPDGRVIDQLPPYERASLGARVQGMQGLTPYARWLDWPFLGLCAGGLGFLVWRAYRR